MSKQQIKELALSNGFKLKQQPSGEMDLNPYVYDFADALLAKANERVAELEKGNKSCAVAIREIIAKGDIGPLLVTGPELDEIVNKFAIENKLEVLTELLDENKNDGFSDSVARQLCERKIGQLRKEQE